MERHWLLKSEPQTFAIADLAAAPEQTTCWEGVRNYQARNYLRQMQIGEQALFYHSNADPPAIVGIVEITRTAYPDPFAFDPTSRYFDPKSRPDAPRWFMVDVRLLRAFSDPLPLHALRTVPDLKNMELLRKGSRLSVQPVTVVEWRAIMKLADRPYT